MALNERLHKRWKTSEKRLNYFFSYHARGKKFTGSSQIKALDGNCYIANGQGDSTLKK
jgi:hypothetical protein